MAKNTVEIALSAPSANAARWQEIQAEIETDLADAPVIKDGKLTPGSASVILHDRGQRGDRAVGRAFNEINDRLLRSGAKYRLGRRRELFNGAYCTVFWKEPA